MAGPSAPSSAWLYEIFAHQVLLRLEGEMVQWKYDTQPDTAWIDLFDLSLVEGPQGIQGIQGIQGPPGTDGTNGTDGADGADGVVQSIVAGVGISVNSADPANPIVTATGGGGGGGGGLAATIPSGSKYFQDIHGAWGSGTFGTTGRVYTWILDLDSEVSWSGVEYSIISGVASAGASIYFELHEVLGHGLPGDVVASVQLDVSAGGDNLVSNFTVPVAIPAGYYFASLVVQTQGSQAPGFGAMVSLTTAASPRKNSFLISDYWTWLRSTSEYNVVYFADTHLPGGSFTPNSDWTGTSLEFADITQNTALPSIALIKT